jgi:putative ABC transport system permease protein
MIQDLRFSLRSLLKQPAFTLIAVLTLGLGIGSTSAIFSLIQGILLTPPPYRHPGQVVLISPQRSDGKRVGDSRGWPAEQWLDWQHHSTSFEAIAAYSWSFNFLVLRDGSESLRGMEVSRDYFRLLGLRPLMGRTFNASETAFPPKPVIILGFNVWQQKFGGDRTVIGKTIRISRRDTPPQVIGVMPPGIRFLPSPTTAREPNYNPNASVDFWIPSAPDPKRLKEAGWNVAARLKDGVTPAQAQSEVAVVADQEAEQTLDYTGIVPHVEPLSTELNRDGNQILWPLSVQPLSCFSSLVATPVR